MAVGPTEGLTKKNLFTNKNDNLFCVKHACLCMWELHACAGAGVYVSVCVCKPEDYIGYYLFDIVCCFSIQSSVWPRVCQISEAIWP